MGRGGDKSLGQTPRRKNLKNDSVGGLSNSEFGDGRHFTYNLPGQQEDPKRIEALIREIDKSLDDPNISSDKKKVFQETLLKTYDFLYRPPSEEEKIQGAKLVEGIKEMFEDPSSSPEEKNAALNALAGESNNFPYYPSGQNQKNVSDAMKQAMENILKDPDSSPEATIRAREALEGGVPHDFFYRLPDEAERKRIDEEKREARKVLEDPNASAEDKRLAMERITGTHDFLWRPPSEGERKRIEEEKREAKKVLEDPNASAEERRLAREKITGMHDFLYRVPKDKQPVYKKDPDGSFYLAEEKGETSEEDSSWIGEGQGKAKDNIKEAVNPLGVYRAPTKEEAEALAKMREAARETYNDPNASSVDRRAAAHTLGYLVEIHPDEEERAMREKDPGQNSNIFLSDSGQKKDSRKTFNEQNISKDDLKTTTQRQFEAKHGRPFHTEMDPGGPDKDPGFSVDLTPEEEERIKNLDPGFEAPKDPREEFGQNKRVSSKEFEGLDYSSTKKDASKLRRDFLKQEKGKNSNSSRENIMNPVPLPNGPPPTKQEIAKDNRRKDEARKIYQDPKSSQAERRRAVAELGIQIHIPLTEEEKKLGAREDDGMVQYGASAAKPQGGKQSNTQKHPEYDKAPDTTDDNLEAQGIEVNGKGNKRGKHDFVIDKDKKNKFFKRSLFKKKNG